MRRATIRYEIEFERRCGSCGVKKYASEYHYDASANDGRTRCCKVCTIARVADWRERNRSAIREKQRAASKLRFCATSTEKAMHQKYASAWAKRNRLGVNAQAAVYRAIRNGSLAHGPCEMLSGYCSGRIHAHHDDYEKRLDVRWLCSAHHRRHHCDLRAQGKDPNHPRYLDHCKGDDR